MVPTQGGSFPKQAVECVPSRFPCIRTIPFTPRLSHDEIIAEIGGTLVTHQLCLRFCTVVVSSWTMEPAVDTGVQVCVAARTGAAPSYGNAALDRRTAFRTRPHAFLHL